MPSADCLHRRTLVAVLLYHDSFCFVGNYEPVRFDSQSFAHGEVKHGFLSEGNIDNLVLSHLLLVGQFSYFITLYRIDISMCEYSEGNKNFHENHLYFRYVVDQSYFCLQSNMGASVFI